MLQIFGQYCNILHFTRNLKSCINDFRKYLRTITYCMKSFSHVYTANLAYNVFLSIYCNIFHTKFFTLTVTPCNLYYNILGKKSFCNKFFSHVLKIFAYKVFYTHCNILRTNFFICTVRSYLVSRSVPSVCAQRRNVSPPCAFRDRGNRSGYQVI